jgi:hypothetical protein
VWNSKVTGVFRSKQPKEMSWAASSFLVSKSSVPALGPIQYFVPWLLATLFMEIKRPEHEADPIPSSI